MQDDDALDRIELLTAIEMLPERERDAFLKAAGPYRTKRDLAMFMAGLESVE